jgi:hypothetical protein
VQRRRTLLAYYVLFSPAYEVTIRPPLHAVRRAAAPVPVVGAVLDKLTEVLESSLRMHAYTTAL